MTRYIRSHSYYRPTMFDRAARRWEQAGPRVHLRIALAVLLALVLATAALDDPALYDPAPAEQAP